MKALRASILFSVAMMVITLSNPSHAQTNYWTPKPTDRFDWQLSEPFDFSKPVDVMDLDLFDATDKQIAALKARGVRLICYINVGAWEDWRADKGAFPREVLGKEYEGWAGERWLDIRRIDLLAPVMQARFDLCKARGFDAIEPDNMNGYQNDTGFKITAKDQLRYNLWLAEQAHARGLSIGLKNTPDQIPELIDHYDWALLEDCFDQGWCQRYKPFVDRGKAVFAVEYTDTQVKMAFFCHKMKALGMRGIMKKRDLDAWIKSCP